VSAPRIQGTARASDDRTVTPHALPRVSAIVTAYNYAHYVGRALESALAQDFPDGALEVIVVDDGSTDGTEDVVRAIAARAAGRIRFVRQANAGLIAATERGLRMARGTYVTILDADDEWPADRTRVLVDFLDRNPEVGLAYGDMEVIDGDGRTTRPSEHAFHGLRCPSGHLLGALMHANFVSAPALMFRASLLDRMLPMPACAPYQDWYLAARAAESGPIAYLPAILARYRHHETSMNAGARDGRTRELYRRELPFRRWMLRELDSEHLTADELARAWTFLAMTAQTVAQDDPGFVPALLDVDAATRERAAAAATEGRAALAAGAFDRAAKHFVRALADDPGCTMATTGLDHAVRRFAVPVPTADVHAGVEDPAANERYAIKAGYRHRSAPEYFVDLIEERDGVVWQPDVYPAAARVARALGATRIIDIGPGSGHKLARLHPEFEVVGLDFGPNLQQCAERFPFGTWREHDLDADTPLPLTPHELGGAVVVCADVIEHLVRPELLLDALRAALEHAEAVVLSTPERDGTRGADHMGPPPHFCHVREWSLDELGELLGRWGFEHGDLGLTRSNDRSDDQDTILAVLFPDAARDARAAAAAAAPAAAPALAS